VIDGAGTAASCRHRFEVQIYANDVGQIVAVNLLTPRDSARSTGP
jgi:hypothetical protein